MDNSRGEFQLGRLKHLRQSNPPNPQNIGQSGQLNKFQRDIYLPRSSYINNIGNMEKQPSNLNSSYKSSIDENQEKQSIPKVIRHFLGYTTAHGMNRLGEVNGVFWKLFWSLVCLGALGMFIFQAHGLFSLYYSKPVSTNVRITFEKQVAFPAITICNLNIIRSDEVPDILQRELASTYADYNASEGLDKVRNRREINTTSPPDKTTVGYKQSLTTYHQTISSSTASKPTGYPDTSPHVKSTSTYTKTTLYPPKYPKTTTYPLPYRTTIYSGYDRYGHTTYYNDHYDGYNRGYHDGYYVDYYDRELLPAADQVDKKTLFLERFATYTTRVPVEQLQRAGHQFEQLVTNCSWRGFDCRNSNYSKWWHQSWNYKYGNCYTFNGGKDNDGNRLRILTTSKPGPSQGLYLQMNIQQSQYLGSVTSGAGVRVTLHDQGAMPFPFEEGFSVSPGLSTSVGIRKTVLKRVDRFNNNSCFHIDELEETNIYRMYRNITRYTKQTCQNSCLGKTQFEKCGCSEYAYPSASPACDAFNDTIRRCLAIVHLKFNNELLPCVKECRQPCSEDIFEKTISMSQWPSTNYEATQKKQGRNFSGNDVLVLNIFYNELNYHRIEESFTYDIINLLADLGGQLGLWIGVSAITCVEVLELLVIIAVQLVRRFQQNDHPKNTVLP